MKSNARGYALIKAEEVTGTGVLYYLEGFDDEGNPHYSGSFCSASILDARQAIASVLITSPLNIFQQAVITEWRVQALNIDTSCGHTFVREFLGAFD